MGEMWLDGDPFLEGKDVRSVVVSVGGFRGLRKRHAVRGAPSA